MVRLREGTVRVSERVFVTTDWLADHLDDSVLKSLGFSSARNYGGGWEEWGNRPDTPVEEE
jgi:3-mercaptopyruvate sulfurtransferase SseA